MARHTLDTLAGDVAALLGESLTLECMPIESPFPDLKQRVRLLAPEILQNMIMDAPVERLTDAKDFSVAVKTNQNGVTKLVLPPDFLRLVAIRMSDWKRTVREITKDDDMKWVCQQSEWAGVRGNRDKPVVTIGYTDSGEPCLNLHGSQAGATLAMGKYQPVVAFDTDDTLDVPTGFYYALVENLAKGSFPNFS